MSKLFAFTMPKWGIEMTEGVIAEWAVEEGEPFTRGQLLASVETDKIVNDIEADFDSVCLRRIASTGDTCAVGALLGVFGDAGTPDDDIDAFVRDFRPADIRLSGEDGEPEPRVAGRDRKPEDAPPRAPEIPEGVRISPRAVAAAAGLDVDVARVDGCGRNGRIQLQDVQQAARRGRCEPGPAVDNTVNVGDCDDISATDVARRIAVKHGIDLRAATGSGRDGRIRVADLKLNADQAAGPERVPFTSQRATIARRLTASYRDIPHYFLQIDVEVDALIAARKAFNQHRDHNASLNDFIVRAVARTLADHPDVNIQVGDNEVLRFSAAHVGIAVATDAGLIAPILKNADSMPFGEFCNKTRQLVENARSGGLKMADLSGGTFTVSNLGMFGVSRFTALINPPQGAILAVGAARRVPVERDGGIAFASVLNLTLGCDHRAIDGAMGGRFLADLKTCLEASDSLTD